jgi:hypothetical protein
MREQNVTYLERCLVPSYRHVQFLSVCDLTPGLSCLEIRHRSYVSGIVFVSVSVWLSESPYVVIDILAEVDSLRHTGSIEICGSSLYTRFIQVSYIRIRCIYLDTVLVSCTVILILFIIISSINFTIFSVVWVGVLIQLL